VLDRRGRTHQCKASVFCTATRPASYASSTEESVHKTEAEAVYFMSHLLLAPNSRHEELAMSLVTHVFMVYFLHNEAGRQYIISTFGYLIAIWSSKSEDVNYRSWCDLIVKVSNQETPGENILLLSS
jgi:hypothetical protein